ncbi:hypothetical protein [Ureaplasma canigenitalium]|uniref:hypothetical protein n=1 Tax=Ureaplasma canigenitalium TaxID=42092 RepID=UPI0004E12993|nr:hypothetical protein [Ureaplasma canigenitalium]
MEEILLITTKKGNIFTTLTRIKKFISDKFSLLVDERFVLKDVMVEQSSNQSPTISVLIKLKKPMKINLEEIKTIQNHLSSFVYMNLNLDTRALNVGIDL